MRRPRRVLSTWVTLPVKWLFPLTWSLPWGAGTLEMLLHPDTTPYNGVPGGAPPGYGWFMLALWVLGTAFAAAFGWGLKRVVLDGDALVVSNYLRRARVPLADVENVRRSRFPHNGGVVVTLARPTALGGRVRFVAAGPLHGPGGIDGLVADLQARVRAARQPRPGLAGQGSAPAPANEALKLSGTPGHAATPLGIL